jgi:UDP-glucose 4-epimerase
MDVRADPEDFCVSHKDWSVTALRYFKAVGAHESGEIDEDTSGFPGNVLSFFTQLAAGRHEELKLFGSGYPTPTGTAVRDYIHAMDVVEGHRLALQTGPVAGLRRFNLGTGMGTPFLELVHGFTSATGQKVRDRMVERRPGDVLELVASPALAEAELGWCARRSLADAWRFQARDPMGYRTAAKVRNVK